MRGVVQYGSMAPWRDMDAGKRTMMQRMSGRVSGLLDDLSDAISLLNDIMPSKASEQVRRSPSSIAQNLPDFPDMQEDNAQSWHAVCSKHATVSLQSTLTHNLASVLSASVDVTSRGKGPV